MVAATTGHCRPGCCCCCTILPSCLLLLHNTVVLATETAVLSRRVAADGCALLCLNDAHGRALLRLIAAEMAAALLHQLVIDGHTLLRLIAAEAAALLRLNTSDDRVLLRRLAVDDPASDYCRSRCATAPITADGRAFLRLIAVGGRALLRLNAADGLRVVTPECCRFGRYAAASKCCR